MSLSDAEVSELVAQARAAREQAYAPYSRFAVGAALLAEGGQVILGANVENASYGLTICAERAAIAAAVTAGERCFRAIAVVADTPEPVSPCGACRQVLLEFGAELLVIQANLAGATRSSPAAELLPGGFDGRGLPARAGE